MNRLENAIRPFAVGRKNWLFMGSPCEKYAKMLNKCGRDRISRLAMTSETWQYQELLQGFIDVYWQEPTAHYAGNGYILNVSGTDTCLNNFLNKESLCNVF